MKSKENQNGIIRYEDTEEAVADGRHLLCVGRQDAALPIELVKRQPGFPRGNQVDVYFYNN